MPKTSLLSQKLRKRAENIHKLLVKYSEIRYGDKDWQHGDKGYRDSKGQNGLGPHQTGIAPQIHTTTSPSRIFYTDEEDPKPNIMNPLFKAMRNIGELSTDDAKSLLLQNRYNIISGLGVVERYDASALIPWLRHLARQITYVLETRDVYSEEIKASYPELLTDLETARSLCDQLSYNLGKQSGVLNKRQFTEMVLKILHYAEVCESSALQLADHHDAFVGGGETSPLEESVEKVWVEEGKTPEEQEEERREREQQGKSEEE
jgi:hypothetical protein